MNDMAMNLNDVAKALTVHRNTVLTLIKNGKLKAVRVSPGRRAVLQSELNRYLSTLSD